MYSLSLAHDICKLVRQGFTIKKICEQPGMPAYGTVCDWQGSNPGFNALYLDACKIRWANSVDALNDFENEVIYFVDEKGNKRIDGASVALAALKCNNTKWAASKLLRVFRDKNEEKEDKTINVYLNKSDLND